jgi:hypothetical protein
LDNIGAISNRPGLEPLRQMENARQIRARIRGDSDTFDLCTAIPPNLGFLRRFKKSQPLMDTNEHEPAELLR